MASNILISYRNLVDAGTVSSDSEVTTLPVANLQDSSRQVRWRSQATSCYVRADLGSAQSLQAVALAGLNLAAADTIRLRLSAVSAGAGELLDTGAVASGVLDGYGTWLYRLAAAVSARYLQIDFAASAPLTYVQAGRLWAGPILSLARNYDYGAGRGVADLSQVRRGTRSGRVFVDVGDRVRTFDFALSGLTDAEARSTLHDMLIAVGRAQQMLVCPDPDGSYVPRETYLGRLEDLRPITHRAWPVHQLPLRVTEDL